MKTLLLLLASFLLCGAASAASPSSINNDDSCDIGVAPAATLLLPYFEVDINGTSGQTTLFTITNVTRYPQIAHVTLWTDWTYPVLTFNLFLTGYDVQAINLADVLLRGTAASPRGTTSSTTPGPLSSVSNGNLRTAPGCGNDPGLLPQTVIASVRNALTIGTVASSGASSCTTAGSAHANAIGYATIDVVSSCTDRTPTDPLYYTTDLLFDNVLIGDYQQIGAIPAGTSLSAIDASGNPMVHIRAIPEGGGAGTAGAQTGTNLPYTFYDRYTPAANRTIDRRQPLPSAFAARFIQGGAGAFATNLKIWREGVTGSGASCASYVDNSFMEVGEFVRFDEHENPFVSPRCPILPCPRQAMLPATSSTSAASSIYPALAGTDVAGWMYLNLYGVVPSPWSITRHPSGVIITYPTATPFGIPRAGQAWVTVTMFGNVGGNRVTAELDAASLGNGCTFERGISAANFGPEPIGPAGGVFVCPPGTTLTDGTTIHCTGTNLTPNP